MSKQEPNVQAVREPLPVCGDIHENYLEMIDIKNGGDTADSNYFFMGDYADRGNYSVECVILLMC